MGVRSVSGMTKDGLLPVVRNDEDVRAAGMSRVKRRSQLERKPGDYLLIAES
jgi:hypothetical protein